MGEMNDLKEEFVNIILEGMEEKKEWIKYRGMNIHPKFIETEIGKAILDAFVDRVEKNKGKR